jgi:hypothetical protein
MSAAITADMLGSLGWTSPIRKASAHLPAKSLHVAVKKSVTLSHEGGSVLPKEWERYAFSESGSSAARREFETVLRTPNALDLLGHESLNIIRRRRVTRKSHSNIENLPELEYRPSITLIKRFQAALKNAYPNRLHRLIWMKKVDDDEAAERLQRALHGALSYFAAQNLNAHDEPIELNDSQINQVLKLISKRLGLAGRSHSDRREISMNLINDSIKALSNHKIDLASATITSDGARYIVLKKSLRSSPRYIVSNIVEQQPVAA